MSGRRILDQMIDQREIKCPSCGNPATKAHTRYGVRHHCDPCGMWSWSWKDLADARTHRARRVAHAVFDTLWQTQLVKRGEAYARLQEAMSMSAEDCHMSLMSAEDAERVPAAVRRIVDALGADLDRFVKHANKALAKDKLPPLTVATPSTTSGEAGR